MVVSFFVTPLKPTVRDSKSLIRAARPLPAPDPADAAAAGFGHPVYRPGPKLLVRT
jgi:hypothetical protein